MRNLCCAACVLGLLLGTAGALRAGDDKEMRALIAKAVKVLGGEDKLARFQAVTLKGSGTFYGLGDQALPISGDWSIQFPDKQFVRIDVKVGDATFSRTIVVNGDKGWMKDLGKTGEMNKKQWAEERGQLYANWVATLVPLKDKAYKLSPVGEVKVGDKNAVGVRVTREGHRDVSLFFDAETALLLKVETVVRDLEGGADKECTQETFFSNYKEIDGVQQAMKVVIHRDGKRFVEVEWSETRMLERLDDSVFARPD
jgi:hypothetical protein